MFILTKDMGVGFAIGLAVMFVVLAFFFYKSYHTYHGDLPGKFKMFLIILFVAILAAIGYVLFI